jgi:hypothetical protein
MVAGTVDCEGFPIRVLALKYDILYSYKKNEMRIEEH